MVDMMLKEKVNELLSAYIFYRISEGKHVSLREVAQDVKDTLNWFTEDRKELSEENADDKT